PEEGIGFEDGADHAERAFMHGRLRHVPEHEVEERRKAGFLRSARIFGHPAVAARPVKDREIELLVGRVERGEQIEHFVDNLVGARVRPVDLVDGTIGFRPTLSALPTTNLVCGIGPSAASTRSTAPSTMLRMRSTSPPKSAWPGVSTILMRVPFQTIDVFLARMVIPRSRSRSLESITISATFWFSRKAPDCFRSASTSVVLPWSTCAM